MSQTTINIETDVDQETLPFNISRLFGKRAKLGGWEGKIWMSEDFNEPMEEFKEY